jgi:EAL domain-containing protein (putative c-di-GMP-specific phosphodiesterase class I)/DICT domain-containing protein
LTDRERPIAPGSVAPASAPASAEPPHRPATHVDINHVINNRLVRTLFQPVVHLSTAMVVGFEALSRGPEGTDLETPTALLEAAKQVGRLGELDWVCRAGALVAALDSRLHPSLSWFINVEAAGLASPCPEDLEAVQARARTNVRVILELTERDVNGHVTHLLTAADQARQSTWGVSLDDIGTEAMSLALLPLLQPDVVKLDMRLLARESARSTASITATVRAYAELSGATILAEGIETTEQAQLAVVFGATYGQGYLYGRPAPLPASVPVPREAIPLRQVSPPAFPSTPFELVSAKCGTQRARKEHLLHISEYLEQQGEHAVMASVLLSCFQRATFFTDARRAQYRDHAAVNAYTLAVGQDFPEHLSPRYRLASLTAGNRMAQEWIVIMLSPHHAAALVARDCGNTGPDRTRHFDFAYTHDRQLVVLAAHSFLFHSSNPDEHPQTLPDAAPVPASATVPSALVEQGPPGAPPRKSRWRRD